MTDAAAVLGAFFTAENARDWETYRSFLHPDAEWVLGDRVIRGIDRYVEAMQAAYGDDDVQFRCEWSHVSESGSLVAALLVDDGGAARWTCSSSRTDSSGRSTSSSSVGRPRTWSLGPCRRRVSHDRRRRPSTSELDMRLLSELDMRLLSSPPGPGPRADALGPESCPGVSWRRRRPACAPGQS
ncbi:nuclear transport factor 2 family protein [Micrococcus porci]|uniref:nuclear transport factor 2 family protein n=1 Tax=Micrococcus porci TaxID=2856555 RepID=UPI003CF54824